MNKKKLIIAALIIAAAVLIGCTAGPNVMEQSIKEDKPAGFWLGIWHGLISLFTFIISLFTDKINVYEVYNNGGWYNFGFIIGISIFYGGGTKGASHKRRD